MNEPHTNLRPPNTYQNSSSLVASWSGPMAVPTLEAELVVEMKAGLGEGSIWDSRRAAAVGK